MVEIRFKSKCPHCGEQWEHTRSTDDTAGYVDGNCTACEGMFVLIYELRADTTVFKVERQPATVERSALVIDEKWKRDLTEMETI